MRFFTLAKAAEMSQHEMVFLTDVSGDDRVFSIKDLPPFTLGEVLTISRKSDEFILEIRSNNGIYEVSAFGRHKFAIYEPDKIAAKNLSVGDRILLRGQHALPEDLSSSALSMSCVSEVREISQMKDSAVEIRLALQRSISTKLSFGSLHLPFGRRIVDEVRMVLPFAAQVEISHESYM